jgi:hypothetical protein
VDGWASGGKSSVFRGDRLVFVCFDMSHLEFVENEFVYRRAGCEDVSGSDERERALQEILL